MSKKAKILEYLEKVAQYIPTPFYWLDIQQRYLGMNKCCMQIFGAISYEKGFTGKTPYDLYPKKMADNIAQHHKQVIQTGEILSIEESIKDVAVDEIKYFHVTIAPLYGDDEKIIGTIGISSDVTADKKEAEHAKKAKVLEHLERIAKIIPAPFYWLDTNNIILGGNEQVIKATGALTYDNYVGKTLYELYPEAMADNIGRANEKIMRTGQIINQEEPIEDITTGEVKYFNAIKAPLYDDDGKIMGTLGISIDITAEKEAERLRLETELQKVKLQEQEQFRKDADQVVHDIRSPIASLMMILKACAEDIPEQARIVLREATTSIGDIANNLLSKYKTEDSDVDVKEEQRQPVMLSLILLHILTNKKYQFKKLPVKFAHDFTSDGNFAFIKIEPTAFKRMMSNLINNSVDAFEGKEGEVFLHLDSGNEFVHVIIQDNGKGIPKEIVDKIMSNIPVTSGKKNGHGLGFSQVRDTLQRNHAEFAIDSTVGKGTKITLTFPRIAPPEWIAKEIVLNQGDIVVILDDDDSIHGAWDVRFDTIADIEVHHFSEGKETIDFIEKSNAKEKLFLLTDFELLKQELNGINVVEKTGIKRALLVTSHYANLIVQDLAVKADIKILPKTLASDVPIRIIESSTVASDSNLKKVDIVLIEDSKMLADGLAMLIKAKGKTVDVYYSGKKFLENFTQYAKETRIYTDFSLGNITGLDIVKKLHEAGYTKLYMFSGWDFEKGDIPDYLTVFSKSDPDFSKRVIGE